MTILPQCAGTLTFPSVQQATAEGIVAIGGNLDTGTLLNAYKSGIFPWYDVNQPIIWWSPNPRTVLFPDRFHVSRSLRKLWRQKRYRFSQDRDFDSVITACADQRHRNPPRGTWISADMLSAYRRLFTAGHAHSIEVWLGNELVGGLYGVSLGKIFFGESMFSRLPNTSKLAMMYLVDKLTYWNYCMIDCQVASDHLFRLGAEEIERAQFYRILQTAEVDRPFQYGWENE